MKIAIIGIGSVGGTLAKCWAALGHEIILGARAVPHAGADALAQECTGTVRVETARAAAEQADVVVLATPWGSTQAAVESLGPLGTKVLIDCTNPWVYGEGLKVGFDTSGAELVATWADGGRVTKTLNQTGFENMADPKFDDHAAVMFVAGDDDEANEIAASLVSELGLETLQIGGLQKARLLEPFAALWIDLAYERGLGRGIAWGLLRRDPASE